MRKLLLTFFLTTLAIPAFSQHRHHHYHPRHNHVSNWIAPIIIGGVVGYAMGNNSRAEPAPSVVYIEQSNVAYTCPYGSTPIFQQTWVIDRWGRSVPHSQFKGCQ